jgi:hypothetical protein
MPTHTFAVLRRLLAVPSNGQGSGLKLSGAS